MDLVLGTLAWDIHSPFLQSKAAHLRASAALLEWFGVGPYCEVVPCWRLHFCGLLGQYIYQWQGHSNLVHIYWLPISLLP